MKKCILCGKTITQQKRRKYCSESCMEDAEQLAKRRPRLRRYQITCVSCGAEYYDASSINVKTCDNPTCRHEFLSKIQRVYKQRPRPVTQAKCPGCGVMHAHVFSPPWIGNGTPRIKCSRYPWCMTSTDITNYGAVYEIENGARI